MVFGQVQATNKREKLGQSPSQEELGVGSYQHFLTFFYLDTRGWEITDFTRKPNRVGTTASYNMPWQEVIVGVFLIDIIGNLLS